MPITLIFSYAHKCIYMYIYAEIMYIYASLLQYFILDSRTLTRSCNMIVRESKVNICDRCKVYLVLYMVLLERYNNKQGSLMYNMQKNVKYM